MIWLFAASGLSALTLVVHIFGGGQSIARPILESDLAPEPMYASYYCWHMVTITIAFMVIAFILPALSIASFDLVWAASILALLFSLWSIGLTLWKKQAIKTLPQWILFLPIAITGFIGAAQAP